MRIAIVAAMEEEVAPIRALLENMQTQTIFGFEFVTGKWAGKEIILAKSGICKVNAAMSTTLLLEHFKPDFVINTGTAGGFHADLQVGNIVVSTAVCQHDVDATGFGYAYGQIPQMETYFYADADLVDQMLAIGNEEMPGQLHKGIIGTGDIFVHNEKQAEMIQERFPDLYAVEMEAGAVGQVCVYGQVPFVVLRGISDRAGQKSEVSFTQFLEEVVQKYTVLLKRIIEQL